ncbi:MAG: hypothetical protein AB1758_11810 [Candidatus Eremiobacterota bacterium]
MSIHLLERHVALVQRFQAPQEPVSERARLQAAEAELFGVNDGYEPWPKDPKDDFEKQKRIEWLRGEIDRLRYLIASYEQRKRDIEQRIYTLGNELYNLRTELDRTNYYYKGVSDYCDDLEVKKVHAKHNMYNAPTPEERAYWRAEVDRLNDEIYRCHQKMQELTYKRNEIESNIRYKTSERDTLTREKYWYDDQIQRERYNLQDREEELRRLLG